jgi:hypothetical protein
MQTQTENQNDDQNGNKSKPLLAVVFNKMLCNFGFHQFTCKIQDCIDEFGFIPNDGRMPKVSKCSKCGVNYR